MNLNNDKHRRWLGAIFIALALGLLVAGQTLLRDRLDKVPFVLYWLACFGFTGLALLVAALDAAIVRRRAQSEQREFLETTLKEIERNKNVRTKKPAENTDPRH